MNNNQFRDNIYELATNLRWSWHLPTEHLLRRLRTSGTNVHPLRALDTLTADDWSTLERDVEFVESVDAAHEELSTYVGKHLVEAPDVVYLSPEFGISDLVPQYSGGLGILAGDHLKAASDANLSLGAVGLLYRQGFFRQDVVDGRQHERYEVHEPVSLGAIDTGVVVDVPIASRTVAARVWKFHVGRVVLLALDTDVIGNTDGDRNITDRLYSGDKTHRLEQELILGIGGVKAVQALGWSPKVHHLNEGHAGFLAFELIDAAMRAGASSLARAVASIREHIMFTTHTPVPAGIDRFDRSLIEPYLTPWSKRWDVPIDEVLALGRDPESGTAVFNMAVLCLGVASAANGVSELHGEVSRQLFENVETTAKIGHVTNGVHARTWVSEQLQSLFDANLGDGWDIGDAVAWAKVDTLSDADVRMHRHLAQRPLAELLSTYGAELDPDALVVGFARRFATYKRATLMLRQRDRLVNLLVDDERPIHFVFAGKAHPADGEGKQLLADIVNFSQSTDAHGRFTFIPDYDIAVAKAMYHGSDVWLNTPVRPHEASGTSGEKAALNGALNCSILDGWWAEMSDRHNGFDILAANPESGFGAVSDAARDDVEATNTLEQLELIVAEFHSGGAAPSAEWIERMRHAWLTLGPKVTAGRMVDDYDRLYYRRYTTR